MAKSVGRTSRMIDVASLALVVAGASCYVWAYWGMTALRLAAHDPNAAIFAGYTRFVRFYQLSVVGLTVVGLGVVVGVGAAIHARRVRAPL
ncbi:MAG TPA: hypothetical protein VIF32_05950 [Gemmatimonadaceae bacterium]